uniref:Uncharacterized protein n=1 Tax=Tanacetum cinerariifolium TaxID=118510 RepID=A0A699JXH9_TANCI|nr:hypothetical protein [Tanacetum cinerariifolium]
MTLPPVILVSNLQSTSQMILPHVHQLLVGTHLIKDCDFYEKQMENKTVGIRVGPVYNRNKVNYQNQSVPQAVLLRTGKVNIPPDRPQPVPTGKPKVSAPVPTGKPKVSTPVPTGKPKVSTPVPTGKPKETPVLATKNEGIFDSGCSRRISLMELSASAIVAVCISRAAATLNSFERKNSGDSDGGLIIRGGMGIGEEVKLA